jgi:hypothetical protein
MNDAFDICALTLLRSLHREPQSPAYLFDLAIANRVRGSARGTSCLSAPDNEAPRIDSGGQPRPGGQPGPRQPERPSEAPPKQPFETPPTSPTPPGAPRSPSQRPLERPPEHPIETPPMQPGPPSPDPDEGRRTLARPGDPRARRSIVVAALAREIA